GAAPVRVRALRPPPRPPPPPGGAPPSTPTVHVDRGLALRSPQDAPVVEIDPPDDARPAWESDHAAACIPLEGEPGGGRERGPVPECDPHVEHQGRAALSHEANAPESALAGGAHDVVICAEIHPPGA